jgi:hypothetical protein
MHWYIPAMLAYIQLVRIRPLRTLRMQLGYNEIFRPFGAYTPGMTFFATDTGLTGSTSSPVWYLDLLVLVRGCEDCMILRKWGDQFTVVGSAFVGNKSRQELEEGVEEWDEIVIV